MTCLERNQVLEVSVGYAHLQPGIYWVLSRCMVSVQLQRQPLDRALRPSHLHPTPVILPQMTSLRRALKAPAKVKSKKL